MAVMRSALHYSHRLTSTNSGVSLKGEVSNRRFFPGELASMKPKSMWIRWPSESSRMFPLCLEGGGGGGGGNNSE